MPKGTQGNESLRGRLARRARSRRVIVHDDSMRPTLLPGDRIYVDPRPGRPLARGDIVVFRDPERPGRLLVKRVEAVLASPGPESAPLPDATVALTGDNPGLSRDSRQFGPVDRRKVVGLAWFRYAPAARRGPLVSTFK